MPSATPLTPTPYTWYIYLMGTRQALVQEAAQEARTVFLELLQSGVTPSEAARQIGRDPAWPYVTRQENPDFAAAWDRLIPVYNGVRADWYEARLKHLSGSDKNPGAVTATIVGLKMTGRFVERDTSADSDVLATMRGMMELLHRAARASLPDTGSVIEGQVTPVSEHSLTSGHTSPQSSTAPDTEVT